MYELLSWDSCKNLPPMAWSAPASLFNIMAADALAPSVFRAPKANLWLCMDKLFQHLQAL